MTRLVHIDIRALIRMQHFNFIWLIAAFSIIIPFKKTTAQGNLLITPNRIVFDGQQKIQELNLANTGKDTARFLISFVEIRMKEDGTFEQISTPDTGQHFASSYLRFFPRNVILAPNEAQVVKLQIHKNAQLATGEYRSHLYFRAEVQEKPLGEQLPVNDTTHISVTLTPVFGITIPAIIRVGSYDAKVSLHDLSVSSDKDKNPVLNVTFQREGSMSVYGDLLIEHISAKGEATNVGSLKGIAVYTPTHKRQLRVPLNIAEGADYHAQTLRVTYTEQPTPQNPKPAVLATAEIKLQ